MAETPEKTISAAGIPVYLHGFSAIDSYLNQNGITATRLLCGAGIADLAHLFEGLRYPGAAFADAAVDSGGKTWYFRCNESSDTKNYPGSSFAFLEFYQDCNNHRFYDPNGIYPLLRHIRDGVEYAPNGEALPTQNDIVKCWKTFKANADPCRALIDQAIILAKYFPDTKFREINVITEKFHNWKSTTPPGTEEQRLLLTGLLEAANPAPGFELLKSSGFIAAYWPELASLDDVDHSKEYHPEGNVWKHTMETLRYRKSAGSKKKPGSVTSFEPQLSLGLLLHDIGKPLSNSTGSRRFDGHAELGERQARRFLERLGFDTPLIHDVCFLVRNHMLPAALPRLPLIRTGDIMASPLFPALLELYRCDESSSFKGLDGYYQSSATYQSFLRHRHNPYRSMDGKKIKNVNIYK